MEFPNLTHDYVYLLKNESIGILMNDWYIDQFRSQPTPIFIYKNAPCDVPFKPLVDWSIKKGG